MTASRTDVASPTDLDALRAQVEAALAEVVPAGDVVGLYEPVRWVLAGGGKRIRPLLVLLTAEAFGAGHRALPAALAVEVLHNATLVHDDIMDHAETRRGRPAVHVQWSESTALLCGDYLLALAYACLARLDAAVVVPAIACLQQGVARLFEGQTLDEAFETRADVTVEAYLDMIGRKTGALLEASLCLGALVGGASPAVQARLARSARHLGHAFQIQDDLLDLTASDGASWGKPIGGDLVAGKKTFLLLTALARADGEDHAFFARAAAGGLPAEAIAEARARMERLGVLGEARAAVRHHTTAALDGLDALPPGAARETLRGLFRNMQARRH